MRGRPAGLYVLWKGAVGWRPAVDVNREVAVLDALAITATGADPRGQSGSVATCSVVDLNRSPCAETRVRP